MKTIEQVLQENPDVSLIYKTIDFLHMMKEMQLNRFNCPFAYYYTYLDMRGPSVWDNDIMPYEKRFPSQEEFILCNPYVIVCEPYYFMEEKDENNN